MAEYTLDELKQVKAELNSYKYIHKEFLEKFVEILCCSVNDPTDPKRYWRIYKDICKILVDFNPKNPPMTEGKLRQGYVRLCELREKYFEDYEVFAALLRRYNRIGYNNICKLAIGFKPEQLV